MKSLIWQHWTSRIPGTVMCSFGTTLRLTEGLVVLQRSCLWALATRIQLLPSLVRNLLMRWKSSFKPLCCSATRLILSAALPLQCRESGCCWLLICSVVIVNWSVVSSLESRITQISFVSSAQWRLRVLFFHMRSLVFCGKVLAQEATSVVKILQPCGHRQQPMEIVLVWTGYWFLSASPLVGEEGGGW